MTWRYVTLQYITYTHTYKDTCVCPYWNAGMQPNATRGHMHVCVYIYIYE